MNDLIINVYGCTDGTQSKKNKQKKDREAFNLLMLEIGEKCH